MKPAIITHVLLLCIISTMGCVSPFLFTNDPPDNGITTTKYQSVQVYGIETGFGSRPYLVTSDKGMILIDAGAPGFHKKILSLMKSLKRTDLKLIIITHGHFDHYGSAERVRKATGAPIVIHALDYDAMASGATPLGNVRGMGHLISFWLPWGEFFMKPAPTKADITYSDSFPLTKYGFHGYITHTPGHTPGSSTVILNEWVAFAGDMVTLTLNKPECQHFFSHNWNQLAQSIRKLQTLQPSYTYPGHGNRPLLLSELLKLEPFLPET